LSAKRMPKGPSEHFGVEVSVTDSSGKLVYGPDDKVLKKKARMASGKLPDGTERSFYFPEGHK
jgi:hypothetical protein